MGPGTLPEMAFCFEQPDLGVCLGFVLARLQSEALIIFLKSLPPPKVDKQQLSRAANMVGPLFFSVSFQTKTKGTPHGPLPFGTQLAQRAPLFFPACQGRIVLALSFSRNRPDGASPFAERGLRRLGLWKGSILTQSHRPPQGETKEGIWPLMGVNCSGKKKALIVTITVGAIAPRATGL